MRFAILGHLKVADDRGDPVHIPQPKIRALVTVMLANANRSVATDRIIFLLWGNIAPPGAVHAVHSYMSLTRRLLSPAHPLRTTRPGYRIDVENSDLDMLQFRICAARGVQAFRNGRYKVAAGSLNEACELWHDASLPDFPATPGMHSIARLLVDELHAARRMLFDARLAIGEYSELIPELRATATDDPGNERAWMQLMLALYRSDMRMQALDTFNQARIALLEASGLDPSPGMKRIHRQMLHDDPLLETAQVSDILSHR